MIPEHRNKKVGWYNPGTVALPDVRKIHESIEHVASKTLERAHGRGLPCCRKRR